MAKSKAMPPQPPIRVSPEAASTGDLIVVHFAAPIGGAELPRVAVGGKPLVEPRLLDAHTLVGHVPDDRAGTRPVRVEGLDGGDASLRHLGRRPEAAAGAALHGVMHFTHLAFAFRRPLNPLLPGSTWYMLGANVSHDANAPVPMTVPLANAWTRTSPTQYTFNYAETILCNATPASNGTTIFLAPSTSSGQGETLAAVDTGTGTTLWTWAVTSGRSRIYSAPVCVDGRIFVARQFGNTFGTGPLMLVCGDASTGAILWSTQLQASTYFGWVRLAAAHGLIFVLTDDGTIAAYHPRTGALRWQRIAAVPLRPNIGRDESMAAGWGSVFVGSTNGLRAFDPLTGTPKWVSSVAFDCSFSQIMVTNANPLVIATDFAGSVHAVNAMTGAQVWQYQGDLDWWPRMTCDFEHLYLQQVRRLVVLALPTGAVREVSPTFRAETSGGPTLCKNRVFQAIGPNPAASGPSVLYVFDRATVSQPVQRFAVNPTYIARPVVEGTQLYLNVSPTAASNFADHGVIQAIQIA